MSRLKGLVSRARQIAKERLPEELLDATRRVAQTVLEHAPPAVASTLERLGAEVIEKVVPDAPSTPAPDKGSGAAVRDRADVLSATERKRAAEVLERLRDKSVEGLKPEDRLVVVYATTAEADDVEQIRASFAGIETVLRHMDLDKEPPQTRQQLAKLTGVMVPPYVYINGRFWGAQYEMATLRASGDLEHVTANRLARIGDEAKRIGKIREHYSDDITAQNIMQRWKLGHILCVDDLDAWYETERDGSERFYYQGGPRPVEDMETVAAEIEAAVDAQDYEATWMLDPAVALP